MSKPDTAVLVYNAFVYTADESESVADSFAYEKNGVILSVGSEGDVREALENAGQYDYEELNMKGAFILPGFQDVHLHIPEAGINRLPGIFCSLDPGRRLSQYIRDLKRCTRNDDSTEWLRAAGASLYDLDGIDDSPLDELDKAFPNRPVIVLDDLGHGAWINSQAMSKAEIDGGNDPRGGIYGRDGSGNFNGLLFENAQQKARDASKVSFPKMYDGLLEALDVVGRNRITSLSDAGGFWTRDSVNVWLEAFDNGDITVRAKNTLYVYPDKSFDEQMSKLRGFYRDGKKETDLLSFNTAKIYVDGILDLGTALLLQEYDYPLNEMYPKGFPYFRDSVLKNYVQELIDSGFSINFHSIGDGATRKALDILEGTSGAKGSRSRITHAYMIDEADEARFKDLNIIADFQMAPDTLSKSYQDEMSEVIGARAYKLIPTDRILDTGALVTISSDWDADPLSPLSSISRALRSGRVPDVETAGKLWTSNPAYALGHDDVTGTIEKGKYADYVVLNKNLFDISKRAIARVEVKKTVLGGRVVYEK
ncbi:Amidohydrolase [Gracilaria domingensis]|nr:Amidohydrolase [Gracilaria domingensis]